MRELIRCHSGRSAGSGGRRADRRHNPFDRLSVTPTQLILYHFIISELCR